MPLPSLLAHGALQCKAKTKHSGSKCQNPAAFGMKVCRMHGARRPHTILKGGKHPNYQHGQETLEAKAARSEKLGELRYIESLMHILQMTKAKRTPGRKPGR